ncbi:THAP domain-containing protein 1-like [Haliotis asinina]|uniref:THAP domain-containing protein 1-like n=1 Tax=Haliotis asinina TaxID=109174 RepID=UPI003532758F
MAADHFCVPLCTSVARNDGSLSFHTFPKPEALRKRWKVAIRRDEGPFFTITRKSVVCSKHFRPEDYKYTPVRRTLKQGSVPSIFPWTLENMKSRKAPAIRHPLMPKNSNSSESPTSSLLDCDPHEEEEDSLSAQTQTDVSLPDTQHLLKRILELEKEKDLLKQQLTIERFGLERFAGNDDLIQYYTSFRSYKLFRQFFEFVKPSASNMCSMYYACANAISLAGRPRNMALIDEMFMFFVRLRLGLPEQDLAVRFNCHISTAS